MDESVQFRTGHTGFHLVRMLNRKNRCLFLRPWDIVYNRSTNMLAASLSYKVFENAVKCAITKVEIGEISSLTEPQSRSLFNFLCGNDTFVSLPTGHGKSLIRHPLHSDGTLSTSQIIFSTKLSNLLHDDLIFLIQGFDPSATRPTYTARINIAVDSLLQNRFQLLTKAAVLLYIECTSFAD